jgi:hypothetical protein
MNALLAHPAVLLGIVIFLVAAIAVKFALKENKKLADKKRAAIKLATDLRGRGLELVPDFLEAFAVGDVGEMLEDIEKVVLLLENSTAMDAEFDKVFASMVKADPVKTAALLAAATAKPA